MRWFLYLRLIVLTAGTLLPFFWMVVILGHRRQRNFERLFFFLCLALTCFFGSSLLALNATLYYGEPAPGLLRFAWTFLCLGLWFMPPLVIHLHAEYGSIRELIPSRNVKIAWLLLAWVPAVVLSPRLLAVLKLQDGFRFEWPSFEFGVPFQVWLMAAIVVAAYWQRRFTTTAPDEEQKEFHKGLKWDFVVLALWTLNLYFWAHTTSESNSSVYTLIVFAFVLYPLWKLLTGMQRFNFLQIGRQRNLIYAVLTVFLALLYLSLVRRASLWFEPYLPPEASAALLLFLPVVFFEPLQRLMRRLLRQTAQTEVDRAQKLMGPINEVARLGDEGRLRKFCEQWIAEQLQLADAKLEFNRAEATSGPGQAKHGGPVETFEIKRGAQIPGFLQVRSFGAMISGETYAALEFLCEQLPAAFDLCRLIEEKLQLERELAERERLALVGQMAASISHNLKNPLGSIKTILQVQMENPELPNSMRGETKMILEEIGRLSTKLNQLLQFSRPAGRGGSAIGSCDARVVVEEVAGVLSHEAERRGLSLRTKVSEGGAKVAASAEALNDIVSNLIVNALEATPRGGQVQVTAASQDDHCVLAVEDDGPGIPAALREKVLQPFFTTKPQGTGLGLAIVARRVAEFGGKVDWESPVRDGHGTRFQVTHPRELHTNPTRRAVVRLRAR